MSAGAANQVLRASSRSAWRERLVPLGALLRRDLLAGGRGARSLTARALASLIAAAAVLISYESSSFDTRNEVAAIGAFALFAGLLVVGFLIGPAIAVSALRLEREAGMLDLLFLAGIRPMSLAFGRMLSTWLFLQSLLFAALPALALFWFFRSPAPRDLVLAAAAVTAHFFAMSGILVAISAWARNAGYAIALSLLILAAWSGLLILGLEESLPGSTLRLLDGALGDIGNATASVGLAEHVAGWTFHGVVGLLSLLVATAGLRRREPAAPRDILRERMDPARSSASARWPLTWLLQRRSAPGRPLVQAVLIVPGLLLVLLAGSWEVLAAFGVLSIAAGLLVTLMVGATSIAPERERRTWTCLTTTRMSGRRIMRDLLGATLLASAVPVLAGLLACFVPASLMAPDVLSRANAVLGALSVLVTWLLAALAGLAASLVSQRSAAAVGLAGAVLIGAPILGLTASSVGAAALRSPLDAPGVASWLALLFAAAFGGTWLVIRAGFSDRWRALIAFAPTLGISLLPLMMGTGRELLALAPFVAFGAAGIALLIHGLRRGRGAMVVLSLLMVHSCIVVPLATLAMSDEDRTVAAFGGIAWCVVGLAASMGEEVSGISGTAAGLLLHALLAAALVVAFHPRVERWIGRAG